MSNWHVVSPWDLLFRRRCLSRQLLNDEINHDCWSFLLFLHPVTIVHHGSSLILTISNLVYPTSTHRPTTTHRHHGLRQSCAGHRHDSYLLRSKLETAPSCEVKQISCWSTTAADRYRCHAEICKCSDLISIGKYVDKYVVVFVSSSFEFSDPLFRASEVYPSFCQGHVLVVYH